MKGLGLKSGLEIHQQLDTGKLFSRCQSKLTTANPDLTINRRLRAMAGETGQVDIAAAHAAEKGLTYLYEVHNNNTSLVELDEEPPELINQEALDIALLLCKMLNCRIIPHLQVMRKTVVDGSNTSGFQRTCLVGVNGHIKTSAGKVSIDTVVLEEDSARRTGETKDTVTYRLDRLGIPLLEIATGPDMKTPEQVKEVAQLLGTMLRSTGKVMRGLGTIRQDVNVSIKGHARVELKGVQELQQIPKIVEIEANRQKAELHMERKTNGHVRNVKEDLTSKFLRPMPGASRMYPETDHPIIKVDIEKVKEMKIPELIPEKIKRYKKAGLNDELAGRMADSRKNTIFDRAMKNQKLNPTIIATTLLSTETEIKRKLKLESGEFPEEFYSRLFKALDHGELTNGSISKIMERFMKGEDFDDIVKDFKPISDGELRKIVKENYDEKLPQGALIGKIMAKVTGKADGKKVAKLIEEFKK
ncbi:MAG: Glu-tRNA(Gln) amidotransferase subunit GatE [Candidatus Nanoarchaeia archaeon]|jgi:Glu-tRNA(Gln) amidotransferase subunit E-like FAD-binding protein|nr:Glu-tRNA(Gln) amidotransferase subunit GatE [Candidatus Nanoarchaeia archaeon]|tara:strand:- start:12 stop:1430 length:1419 start_codon:yes stop_codon:yes gene_type:complete